MDSYQAGAAGHLGCLLSACDRIGLSARLPSPLAVGSATGRPAIGPISQTEQAGACSCAGGCFGLRVQGPLHLRRNGTCARSGQVELIIRGLRGRRIRHTLPAQGACTVQALARAKTGPKL